ncbi:general secretion pathway protein GspD [Flavivirga amylovorans]|uniref:General secretion pathway protein GspD n=1 Tax=Flavivirga amylovorans TaxID=870486 RepID=A0ABT8WX97_9FLAO|nr:general secretion pathway protein GspD [Flavivirga amylovorans]MDO5986285.1 general secretion pathway protein GspD [Flavivirga amylovorans]
MKKSLYILLLFVSFSFAQNHETRIQTIKNQLDILAVDNVGLTEQVKTEISINNITLPNFLLAVSNIHKVNINIGSGLENISVVNNFSNVTVADLLVFLCKEYDLYIDFTGNIISIKKYIPPVEKPKERIIPISFNPEGNTLTIDAKDDNLYIVFKHIMDETGKNLVFTTGMESKTITSYIKDMPFDAAMDKLALANNLFVEKTKDGFYVFEDDSSKSNNLLSKRRSSNLNYKILDFNTKLLEVDFVNTPITNIINDLGSELNLNIFTATPLDEAGNITFKTRSISFDDLLVKIFESQVISNQITVKNNSIPDRVSSNSNRNSPNQNTISNAPSKNFTFKKENNTYFFGTENQLSVRKVEIIPLISRTVEMFADPSGGSTRNRTVGRTNSGFNNFGNTNFNNGSSTGFNNQFDTNNFNRNTNRVSVNANNQSRFGNTQNSGEALLSVLPNEIIKDLDIKVDFELNSFYIMGSSSKIEQFKAFIRKIDKPVPVILIEVMLIEVNRNSTIEAGVSWGIGDESVETSGAIFPETDLTLGAKTINKVLNGFDGFGHINLGKVVPNFFATIKAMESNGNIKIRSTPKLSTLNGHRATFSNGQTSYYAVTQRNVFGTDNPQTSEITNYEPIDAELGLTIKPLVSGDGQVTLDIFVVQSSFGARIAEDAPPDLSSREFSSIIRVQDQDIVVLGGLEEQVKNDSGSGIPFLARVPLIKWLFSKRKREDSKSKLTVLIKPTVIY